MPPALRMIFHIFSSIHRKSRPATAFHNIQPAAKDISRNPRSRSCVTEVATTNNTPAEKIENRKSNSNSNSRLPLFQRRIRNTSYSMPSPAPAMAAYWIISSCSVSGLTVITGTACGEIRLPLLYCHHIQWYQFCLSAVIPRCPG